MRPRKIPRSSQADHVRLVKRMMSLFGIPYEERVLAGTFGDEYAAYRRRVRRWL